MFLHSCESVSMSKKAESLGQRYKHLKCSRHCQIDKASIVVQSVDFLKVENAAGHLEESVPTARSVRSFWVPS